MEIKLTEDEIRSLKKYVSTKSPCSECGNREACCGCADGRAYESLINEELGSLQLRNIAISISSYVRSMQALKQATDRVTSTKRVVDAFGLGDETIHRIVGD